MATGDRLQQVHLAVFNLGVRFWRGIVYFMIVPDGNYLSGDLLHPSASCHFDLGGSFSTGDHLLCDRTCMQHARHRHILHHFFIIVPYVCSCVLHLTTVCIIMVIFHHSVQKCFRHKVLCVHSSPFPLPDQALSFRFRPMMVGSQTHSLMSPTSVWNSLMSSTTLHLFPLIGKLSPSTSLITGQLGRSLLTS